MPCLIEIQKKSYPVRVGCTEKEQAEHQTLEVILSLESAQPFQASFTDRLEDTLDVDQLNRCLSNVLERTLSAPIQTLEYLGQQIQMELQSQIYPRDRSLNFSVTLIKSKMGWKYVHSWQIP